MKLLSIAALISSLGFFNNKAHAQSKSPSNEQTERITIIIQHVDEEKADDTLYLLPKEIITNTEIYDDRAVMAAHLAYNYNPYFINWINQVKGSRIMAFSVYEYKGQDLTRPTPFDIEVREFSGITQWLSINNDGKGCFHWSAGSSNKLFEILFTPTFANLLQSLKNEI